MDPDEDGSGGWMPLVGQLGTLDLERDPDDLAIDVEAIRVFAGYAGWGPGQLETEVDAGAWFVVLAERRRRSLRSPRAALETGAAPPAGEPGAGGGLPQRAPPQLTPI